jgi:hypothetical protein
LLDAAQARRLSIEFVKLSQGGADDPAVVGRVDAAAAEGPHGAAQKGLGQRGQLGFAVAAGEQGGGGDGLDCEGGIGRRVEVGDQQVNGAVGVLGALQVAGGQTYGFDQPGVTVVLRAGVQEGGSQGGQDGGGRAGVVEAEGVGIGAAPRAGGIPDLAAQQVGHSLVVALQDRPIGGLGGEGGQGVGGDGLAACDGSVHKRKG